MDGDYQDEEVGYCDGLYVSEDGGIGWQYTKAISGNREESVE